MTLFRLPLGTVDPNMAAVGKHLTGATDYPTQATLGMILVSNGQGSATFQPSGTAPPNAHVLATTTGLGPQHTTSGLTAGMLLRATGATTAAFANVTAADINPGVFPNGTFQFAVGGGALIVGPDPGGSEIFRVGGSINLPTTGSYDIGAVQRVNQSGNGNYTQLFDPTGRVAVYLGGGDQGNYSDNTTHYFRSRTGTAFMVLDSGSLRPAVSGGITLGASTLPWGPAWITNTAGTAFVYGRSTTVYPLGVKGRVYSEDDTSGNEAGYSWRTTGAAVDTKMWDAITTGPAMTFRFLSDNEASATTWLQVNRSGMTFTSAVFGTDPGDPITGLADLVRVGGNFVAKQQITALGATGVSCEINWYQPDQTTDSKQWDIIVSGLTLQFRAVNDANSLATPWLNVIRSGISIGSVTLPVDNNGLFLGTTHPIRIQNESSIGASAGRLWVIPSDADSSTSKSFVSIGTAFDNDRGIDLRYTPGTTGAFGGALLIGQVFKNAANFTHETTDIYSRGVATFEVQHLGVQVLSGTLGIQTPPLAARLVNAVGTVTADGSNNAYGMVNQPAFQSGVTANGVVYYAQAGTQAAVFTVGAVYGYYVDDANKGAGSTITTQYGLYVVSQTKGTNNVAIQTNAGAVNLGDNTTISGTGDPALFFNAGTVGSTTWLYGSISGVGKFRVQRDGKIAGLSFSVQSGTDINAGTLVFNVANTGAITNVSRNINKSDNSSSAGFWSAANDGTQQGFFGSLGGLTTGTSDVGIFQNGTSPAWCIVATVAGDVGLGRSYSGGLGGTQGVVDGTWTRFGGGSLTTQAYDVLSFDPLVNKWRPRFLQTQVSTGVLTASANADGTFSVFAFDGRTLSGTSIAGPTPTVTAVYGGFIIDMGSTPPTNFAWDIEWTNSANGNTGGPFRCTSQKAVFQFFSANSTVPFGTTATTFQFKVSQTGGTAAVYGTSSAALAASLQTEVNAFGLIVASQIACVNLAAISADLGVVAAGVIADFITPASQTKGIFIKSTAFQTSPGANWTGGIFFAGANPIQASVTGLGIDFTATGTNPILRFQGGGSTPLLQLLASGAMDVGPGATGSPAVNLARIYTKEVLDAPVTGGAVSSRSVLYWKNDTGQEFVWGARIIARNVYTSSTTWTKSASTVLVMVHVWGGGGGGGGGSTAGSGANAFGGSGGGGGAYAFAIYRAQDLGATATITVGAGGTAGAGGAGGVGGTSSFVSGSINLSAYGGAGGGTGASAGGGGGGLFGAGSGTTGGTGFGGTGGATGTVGLVGGGGGGSQGANGGGGSPGAASHYGGGGGGGGSGPQTTTTGGAGGASNNSAQTGGGGAGGTSSVSGSGTGGTAGANAPSEYASGAGGGGGGAGAVTTGSASGGAGGNGGAPGGGGGGGGGAAAPNSPGAGSGGVGGGGQVIVYELG